MSSTENKDNQAPSGSPENIPPGFTVINGPNDQPVLVPRFMVPATKLAIEAEIIRAALWPDQATTGPRPATVKHCEGISEDPVNIPADPPFSDREALALHAEVKALQQTLGISYKDAAHRLYMAEVAKMSSEQYGQNGMVKIREHIDNTIINEIYPPLVKIDSGDFDTPRTAISEGG